MDVKEEYKPMKAVSRVTIALLTSSVISFAAQPKFARDLDVSGGGDAAVIIQFTTTPSERHHQKVKALGGTHKADLSRAIKGGAYSIPRRSLEALANDPEVAYITPDRPVHGSLDYAAADSYIPGNPGYSRNYARLSGTSMAAPMLSAVVEMSLLEVCMVAAVGSLVQCLWSPAHRLKLVQVSFSVASMVLAGALAFGAVRLMGPQAFGESTIEQLAAAAIMYVTSTLLLSTMLCLAESAPLTTVWRHSHFWVFPYYLVGAAAAAILVSTSRTYGWMPSLLVLPTMVLVYVSYKIQVKQQIAGGK
jgi:hypothetical protein